MTTILVINGPNLNRLGKRNPGQYGTVTLAQVEESIRTKSDELGVRVETYQSNHEGDIVDFIQEHGQEADGVVINAGALTQVGYSILDALLDAQVQVIEVHVSNIHAREEFRRHSVIAPFAVGQVAGLGWRGYLYALEELAIRLTNE
jgi:3-dehydroquinate dehydratase-2